MRNGDVYRIQGMRSNGKSDEEIILYFCKQYSRDEILKFIPKPKPKRGRPRKKEVVADERGINM